MFTDTANGVVMTGALQRRGVGKAAWKRVLDNIIANEREDLLDLATLRQRISDPALLKIIAQMQERKTLRVMELTQLYHYKDEEGGAACPATTD